MGRATDLNGKHALVCGASMGIGQAAAMALAGLGASVTVLARSEAPLRALLPRLKEAGAADARYLTADLDDRAALEQKIRALLEESGAVHVLVNNTGGPPHGPILEAAPDDFLAAFSRHVLAAHLLVQVLLPGMRASGYGRVINVVSTSVYEPIPGLGVSNTTRAAMAGWAKSISVELPPGVTINNVLPGFTDTERLAELKGSVARSSGRSEDEVAKAWLAMIPEGRLARPEELGGVIAFLASPAAGYVRGQSLAVDGGRMKSI